MRSLRVRGRSSSTSGSLPRERIRAMPQPRGGTPDRHCKVHALMDLRLDCRHYRGEKPCRFGCVCADCTHYAPMGARILVVKLDAVGDVVRTTTILRPLRRKYDPCHITWLVHPAAEELLAGNPLIDLVLVYRPEDLESLRVQEFDLVLSLDKSPRATAVATWVRAAEKLGFGLSRYGTLYAFNPEAEYALRLGLDDDLKFRRNTRTYQEVIFEAIRLPYALDEYCMEVGQEEREEAAAVLRGLGVPDGASPIGLNMGGGSAFANKMWDAPQAIAFIAALRRVADNPVLLFGGEPEEEKVRRIVEARLPGVYAAMTPRRARLFEALLARCGVVVTGDSLGMHLAIAERRPVVVLFGPTCPQEIELYGRGEKIVSPVDCAPCYRNRCVRSPNCMEAIRPETVVQAVTSILRLRG